MASGAQLGGSARGRRSRPSRRAPGVSGCRNCRSWRPPWARWRFRMSVRSRRNPMNHRWLRVRYGTIAWARQPPAGSKRVTLGHPATTRTADQSVNAGSSSTTPSGLTPSPPRRSGMGPPKPGQDRLSFCVSGLRLEPKTCGPCASNSHDPLDVTQIVHPRLVQRPDLNKP